MSFLHPGRLWLLLAVVGLVVLYVALHRRRRRAIERYTSTHLHGVIAPDRLGWRRHVAPGLAGAALVLVVLGLAQPAQAERVPRNEGVVILAVDVSASMAATDIAPSRLEAAIDGASQFVEEVRDRIQVGLVAFDGTARVLVEPTTDHASVVDSVQGLTTGPRTATGEALATSLDAITATLSDEALAAGDVPASIVLLSDGVATVGRPPEQVAQQAAELGVPVTTIAYGTPTGTVIVEGEIVGVPADTETMADVADITAGRFFEATTAGELDEAYTNIRTVVGYTTARHEVTRAFLGGAFVLLVAGAPFALVRAGRAL